jgi:Cu/Ag efflux pump CusA
VASRAPVSVNLYGDDVGVLTTLADELAARMAAIDGLEDVRSSLAGAEPTLSVRVDRDAASDLGVGLSDVGDTLRPLLVGEEVTDWTAPDGRSFAVVVRMAEDLRNDADALGALPIVRAGAAGSLDVVRLDQVADIVEDFGPAEIDRLDLDRQVEVTANLAGATLGAVVGRGGGGDGGARPAGRLPRLDGLGTPKGSRRPAPRRRPRSCWRSSSSTSCSPRSSEASCSRSRSWRRCRLR